MKDMWFRVRIWIAWHAMPKDARPIFVKALGALGDELLKELKALEKEGED